MKIITCLKPVPDPASRLFINDDKTWIKDRDLTFVASEADLHGIEEGLRLRDNAPAAGAETGTPEDRGEASEVVALSIGEERAARVLRAGLAMGADRGIQVSDARLSGGDEYASARVVSRVVEKDAGCDLLLFGVQSDDLGSGMTGVMAAELLGWAHASVVVGVEVVEDGLRVRRELEGGVVETLHLPTPCVLTIQFGINHPRYTSLKGIMAAKKKEMTVWNLDALGLDGSEVGSTGALYDVREVFVPERDREARILSGSPAEVAAKLVEKLRMDEKVI